MRDTKAGFGSVTIWLHWIVAAGFIALAVTGELLEFAARGPARSSMLGQHVSLGYVLMIFFAARLVWRAVNPLPALTDAPAWENALARISHAIMWLLILGLPLSGWLAASSGRGPMDVYGWFDFPRIWTQDRAMHGAMEGIHAALANLFLAMFAAHLAGALWREYVRRDGTLSRMLGRTRR
jgi:cytochrome b561